MRKAQSRQPAKDGGAGGQVAPKLKGGRWGMGNLREALAEYAAIVEGTREEYTKEELTISIIREDHPELNFMDDEEIETIIRQANEGRKENHERRKKMKNEKRFAFGLKNNTMIFIEETTEKAQKLSININEYENSLRAKKPNMPIYIFSEETLLNTSDE